MTIEIDTTEPTPDDPPTTIPFDELRWIVRGRVIDADVTDEAATPWDLAMRHDPVVTVVAADGADVAATVQFAAIHELPVGVQSTGHGPVLPVDGMLIVTSEMDAVSIDPEARTARVAAGATWARVLDAAQAHGLAPLLGSAPHVGAVGYTLGGGLGWLARKHGPACDAVRSFDAWSSFCRVSRAFLSMTDIR